jgi:hypothetical protein
VDGWIGKEAYPEIYHKEVSKTAKNAFHDSGCPGQDASIFILHISLSKEFVQVRGSLSLFVTNRRIVSPTPSPQPGGGRGAGGGARPREKWNAYRLMVEKPKGTSRKTQM